MSSTSNKSSNVAEIPMGGLVITSEDKTVLQTFVGSCVAVCIYDTAAKVAGMAHVMLPKNNTPNPKPEPEGKFADVAFRILLEKMIAKGASIGRLKAKLAGGANIFHNEGKATTFNIGLRNVEMIKGMLAENKIPLVSEDVGSKHGRWVVFDINSSEMKIRDRERGAFTI